MAERHPFGGSAEDWIFAEDASNVPILQGGAVLTFWNAREGGSQYTDITQDKDGATPIAELKTSPGGDGYRIGTIPVFYGPPDVTSMWVSADGGERVAIDATDTGDVAAKTQQTLTTHMGQRNAHGTGLGDLSDVQVGAPESRATGTVVGWTGSAFGMLTPAQMAGAVLLNPPLDGGGAYVGNVVLPPPAGQTNPWLQMRQPYSSTDSNPDAIQLYSTHSDGTTPLKTFWTNGNNEGRGAPSTPNRVAFRVFEAYETRGGPSTSRFFELSTNPSNAGLREPLFGAYGTAHATQPGWMVATRVLAGLLGVRAGGNYNGLSALNFRGVRPSAGAPTSGTWATNDVVMDSAGAWWLCTAGGTPGSWTSAAGGGSGSAGPTLMPTWFQDTAAVGAGTYRVYNSTGNSLTLRSVVASIGGTPPAGSSLIVQARVDGTAVFTSGNRPTIPAGSRYSGVASTFISAAWPAGSYVTVDVDQVGSTTAGSKLTIQVLAY